MAECKRRHRYFQPSAQIKLWKDMWRKDGHCCYYTKFVVQTFNLCYRFITAIKCREQVTTTPPPEWVTYASSITLTSLVPQFRHPWLVTRIYTHSQRTTGHILGRWEEGVWTTPGYLVENGRQKMGGRTTNRKCWSHRPHHLTTHVSVLQTAPPDLSCQCPPDRTHNRHCWSHRPQNRISENCQVTRI